MSAASLEALAKQLAAVDDFELEVELAQPETDGGPARVPLGLIRKSTLGEHGAATVPSNSLATIRRSDTVLGTAFNFDDDEAVTSHAPRRVTHDGTHGRAGETSTMPSASRDRPTPASDPARIRRVRWAPEVQSPTRKTRQTLHKRAREVERQRPEPPSWGELPSGAKRSRKGDAVPNAKRQAL